MEKIEGRIQDTGYRQLQEFWETERMVITLAYTPICGTCQVAKRMLEVLATLLPDLTFTKINLNYDEQFSRDYEIMSVPCLIIYCDKECKEKIYALNSVPFLYKKITSYL